MLTWLILLLYPAPLLMVATLIDKRVSVLIMLITQALLLIGPLIRLLLGQAPFAGFENSGFALIVWVFIGLLVGWPIAESFRRMVDRRRETITSTIILPQAFHSTVFATIITTLLNVCWQQIPLGWPIDHTIIGNWLGLLPTLIILVLCLLVGLIGLPKYLRAVLYQR
jgi:hypothetical protein